MITKKILIAIVLLCLPNIGFTQSYPIYKNTSAIAVLDQEALFTESDWGKRILKDVEEKVIILSAENRSIEKKLEIEEFELTKTRKIIKKVEFDILALEFDTKVKDIRDLQADKQRKINVFLNENRALFFETIRPMLLSFIDELGVEVLLDKDTVALASTGSDITNITIKKVNDQFKSFYNK